MKAAGEIFKAGHLQTAPKPTTFVFGRESLYDPATMDYGVAYGKLGDRVMPTTYRYGSRMMVDPSREDDEVIGPAYAQRIFEPCPIRPTDEIEYDWRMGHLKFDSPSAAAYAGFFANHGGPVKFSSGVVLDKVQINNPEDIAYPVTEDELYVSFCLVSRDGRPLAKTRDALISLVSTSFNSGFKLDHSKFKSEYLWQRNPGATVSIGKAPVLVARAGATLTVPMLDGAAYTMKDWHLRPIASGVVADGILVVPAGQPVFTIELRRDGPLSGNVIRNGNFEGSMKYWMPTGKENEVAVSQERPAQGESCLKLAKGYIRSASFRLPPGGTATVSCFARTLAEGPGRLHLDVVPSHRNSGKVPYRTFWGKHGWKCPRELTGEWQRVSWQVPIPDRKFGWPGMELWDRKGWILLFSGGNVALDGVSVSTEGEGAGTYLPHAPIEVAVRATNLPGYTTSANILDREFEPEFEASLHNPGSMKRQVTLRWQQLDYAGERAFGKPVEEELVIDPGRTVRARHTMPLLGNGLLLARASVLDEEGDLISKSDQPLTVLASPKAATTPDPEERFGGTLVAGNPYPTHMIQAAQRIGLAWSRWYPHLNWGTIQPEGPDQWNWEKDEIVDALHRHGISIDVVLYALPKWAKGKHSHLPRDMEDWSPDDKRWQDLSVTTHWDRYVTELMKHYAGRSMAWEVVNEAVWGKWDPKIYLRFVERTYRLIKKNDSKAKVLIDGVYGVDALHQKFLDFGGADCWDVFTFHNYGGGAFSSYGGVQAMHARFRSAGRAEPAEIWFNEGWTHWPTSEDYPANSVLADRSPANVAHTTVRATAATFAAGMHKLIVFNMGYPSHGRSWYDWGMDGTSWYDDHDNPTVAIGVFNVLADQLGLCETEKIIYLPKGIAHVFQDQRHNRGVAVIWAEEPKTTYDLPLTDLVKTDVMGNSEALPSQAGKTPLVLAEPLRPWYVTSKEGLSGTDLAAALSALEQKDVSLAAGRFSLPRNWAKLGDKGNPFISDGKPIWRLDRVWPPDPGKAANYHRFPAWNTTQLKWTDNKNTQGGNPAASLRDGLSLSCVTPWKGGDKTKPSALVFVAPKDATYRVAARVNCRRWTGRAKAWMELYVLDRGASTATRLSRYDLPNRQDIDIRMDEVKLKQNQELAFVLNAGPDHFTGVGCKFLELKVETQ